MSTHMAMMAELYNQSSKHSRIMKINTTSIHFHADPKLIDYIQRKAAKLDQFFDRIIDTHIYLKLENSGQVRDKIVEMKLLVPGDILVATEVSKTFEASTDAVVNNMKRQLSRYKERIQTKSHHSNGLGR